MAGKSPEYSAYNGLIGTAHTRERGMRTGGSRIFVDPSKSEREKRQEHRSLDMGFTGKMQGGRADG